MRESTIARNYAETLLELARRANDVRGYGELVDALGAAIETDKRLRVFLESPAVSGTQKNKVLTKAFDGQLPRTFVRFLEALVNHRRQMLLPDIGREYRSLLDEVEGRIHASVTVAHDGNDGERDVIVKQLSRVTGKEVVPHMRVNPAILGGVVVRLGDTVLDGSVRRRLAKLRARMLTNR